MDANGNMERRCEFLASYGVKLEKCSLTILQPICVCIPNTVSKSLCIHNKCLFRRVVIQPMKKNR